MMLGATVYRCNLRAVDLRPWHVQFAKAWVGFELIVSFVTLYLYMENNDIWCVLYGLICLRTTYCMFSSLFTIVFESLAILGGKKLRDGRQF